MTEVVIAGASPNGLMLACELGLAGIRPVVLVQDPMQASDIERGAGRGGYAVPVSALYRPR